MSTPTYDAVEVRVEAPDVMGGVAAGRRGGTPQWLQALLVPHVGSTRPAAVRGGQVQGRPALQRTERIYSSLPADPGRKHEDRARGG